jgi:DNA repair protein RadD
VLVLRDYQNDMLEAARARIRAGVRNLLLQSPTGSGKTVLVAQMLKTAESRGYRAWFNVHRIELVRQSMMTLTQSADLDVGIVAAKFPGNRSASAGLHDPDAAPSPRCSPIRI